MILNIFLPNNLFKKNLANLKETSMTFNTFNKLFYGIKKEYIRVLFIEKQSYWGKLYNFKKSSIVFIALFMPPQLTLHTFWQKWLQIFRSLKCRYYSGIFFTQCEPILRNYYILCGLIDYTNFIFSQIKKIVFKLF